jgi:glycosyltransferase involved in cell wall biosynthesis
VLHDLVIHHLIAGLTLGRGDAEGYRAAMFREDGVVGRLLAHGVVDGLVPPLWETRAEQFPLTKEVLNLATGVIVHSRYVEAQVQSMRYGGPVWRVPHPAWPRPRELPPPGLPKGRFPVVGCFGNLTTTKRVPQLVAAFRRVLKDFPEALLLLVGRPAPGFALEPELRRHGVGTEDVLEIDYVDELRLWSLMDAVDVAVNLRWPTMGETSGTAIRSLVLGTPIVVSDVGWFSELPDGTVEKVRVGPQEVDVLADALARLSRDAGLRTELGRAAQAYVRGEHDLEHVADEYARALEDAAGRPLLQDEISAGVARAASEVGIQPLSPEAGRLGEAMSEVGLGD